MKTKQIDFSKYTSVRIGGSFAVQILKDEADFAEFESIAGGAIIGGGNNLLISPAPPHLAMLSEEFDRINLSGDVLSIGAATKSGKIYSFAKKQGLGGFEFLRHIGRVERERISFGYRRSGIEEPILGAEFKISRGFDVSLAADFAAKRANQPKGASFGSCFKNPPNDAAGRLIEAAGLKGHAIGGAKFSEQHANFIINFGGASFENVMSLIDLARERVLQRFGVALELEVKIL